MHEHVEDPAKPRCSFCGMATEDNCETVDDLQYCGYTPSTTNVVAPSFSNQTLARRQR